VRNKKETEINKDLMKKASDIANEFNLFTHGYRTLLLIHRAKEGAVKANNSHLKKYISANKEEFVNCLYRLLYLKENSKDQLRIYSQVNSRNFDKAIREYKERQLEADYYSQEDKYQFYRDTHNRFVSSFSKPSCKIDSYFIVDCDSIEEWNDALEEFSNANLNDKIIQQYPTKNGWHIVTHPFNPNLLSDKLNSKINRDGLLLLSY
jgi:hypothetical protein